MEAKGIPQKGVPPMAELPQAEEININDIVRQYLDGQYDLICILGPTASGKTGYAVKVAHKISEMAEKGEIAGGTAGEIISADSRQVYRGMDIGTGKDLGEYGDVAYHLIDIVDAGTKYNIYEYQRDFEKAWNEVRKRGNVPILCGGSGLYIEAAAMGYSLPDVPADPDLRAELEMLDTPALIRMLESMKKLHNTTDTSSRKRLIRAIEIAVYESEHPVSRTSALPKKTCFIGTLVSREDRNARIDRRLDARLAEGMVEEVRRLMDSGLKAEDLIYYGLEYKFVTLYLTGVLEFDDMKKLLATAIHQFAKRQMTWFRGMERRGVKIHWINAQRTASGRQENCAG